MFIYLALLLPAVNAKLLSLPDELSSRNSLSKCVLEVVTGLGHGETVSVSLSTKPPAITRPSAVAIDQIMLNDIFAAGRVSVVTEKVDAHVKRINCTNKVAGYVIQIRDMDEIIPALSLLHSQKHWNPHAYFLVITTSIFDDRNQVLAAIVEDLASFKVINVLILFPKELESMIYNVYSWYPYSAGKCGDDYNVKKIGFCKNGGMSNVNLFKNKIPKNLMGCPVKVRTSIIEPFVLLTDLFTDINAVNLTEGLEIKLMKTIAELRNVTFIYSLTKTPNFYGSYFGNNLFNGSFADLQQERIDILLGYVASRPETQVNFDPVSAYYQDSLILCVPHAERIKDWNKLTTDFDNSAMAIFFVIGTILTILTCRIAKYQKRELNMYRHVWSVATNVYSSTFGVTIQMPKTWKLRLLFLCWVYFCFHAHIAYQSTLVSSMSRHRYVKQISTLEDVLDNGLIIQYYPYCERFYNSVDFRSDRPLLTVVCNGIQKCINRTAYDRKYAVCTPKLNVLYLMSNFIDENSDPLLYCFPNAIASYPIEMLLWKGHPLKNIINDLVHRIRQSGFFDKWQRDTFYNSTRSLNMRKLMNTDETGLNLQQLAFAFLLTCIGLGISSIAFVLERFVYYTKSKKEA